jgi:hypothetical protein
VLSDDCFLRLREVLLVERDACGAERGIGGAEAPPDRAGTATGLLHSGQRTFLPAYFAGTLNS